MILIPKYMALKRKFQGVFFFLVSHFALPTYTMAQNWLGKKTLSAPYNTHQQGNTWVTKQTIRSRIPTIDNTRVLKKVFGRGEGRIFFSFLKNIIRRMHPDNNKDRNLALTSCKTNSIQNAYLILGVFLNYKF